MSPRNFSVERKHRRHVVYRGEVSPMQLRCDSGAGIVEVADISVHGLGILMKRPLFEDLNLQANERVSLALKRFDEESDAAESALYRVVHFRPVSFFDGDYIKVGLEQIPASRPLSERRNKVRHAAPLAVKTLVTFFHPLFPLRKVYGEVSSMSPLGLAFVSSFRNGDLIAGHQVRMEITFPLSGVVQCLSILKGVTVNDDRETVSINVEIIENLQEYQERAVEVLLMSPDGPSLTDLRAEGYSVAQSTGGVSFDYRSDWFDLKEIAKLRMVALHYQGEMLDETEASSFIDSYDYHSRHTVARLNSKVIAASRLIYNDGDPERVEHLKYGAKIPDWLWQAGFVEGGRLVTHPEYRGADLFVMMTRFYCKTALGSGYRYMLSSCVKSLERVYLRSGCRKIGTFYIEGDDQPWSLLVMDFINTSKGRGVNPIYWNLVQRPMVEFLIEKNRLPLNWYDRCLLFVYRCFGPISRFFYERKNKISSSSK